MSTAFTFEQIAGPRSLAEVEGVYAVQVLGNSMEPAYNPGETAFDTMTAVTSAMLVAVNKSIIDLLRDRNSTPHKLPTKIGNLVASAGFSTMPPIKLSMHEIDQALSTRNLSVEQRIQIKYTLSRIGLV